MTKILYKVRHKFLFYRIMNYVCSYKIRRKAASGFRR